MTNSGICNVCGNVTLDVYNEEFAGMYEVNLKEFHSEPLNMSEEDLWEIDEN